MEKYYRDAFFLWIIVLILVAIPSSNAHESMRLCEAPFDVKQTIESISANKTTKLWPREGEFLIDTSTVYIPAVEDQFHPSICFDGINYLVVWQDSRGGLSYDIYGARVTPTGVVLDTVGIAISNGEGSHLYPSVAFDGTNYLVVWENIYYGGIYGGDIYGARIDRQGAVLDTTNIAISTAASRQCHPSIAFGGSYYLAVWEDLRNYTDYDIYGARLNRSGVVIDTEGIAISIAWGLQSSPAVASDDTSYLVVWRTSDDIHGTRIDQFGVVLDTAGIAISNASRLQCSPSVTFGSMNYLVVWEDFRNGSNYDIYGARLSQSGSVLDTAGIPISTAPSDQYNPSVAFDGTNYLATWNDGADQWADVYGARVNQSGSVLDTAGIAISTSAEGQSAPSVDFGGVDYLVVWEDTRNSTSSNSDVYGTRVDQTGTVQDTSGIVISSAADWRLAPAAASSSTQYLVAWADVRNFGIAEMDIYGARVDQSGIVLDPTGIAISTTADSQWAPSVASDGTDYLVVWSDYHLMSFISGTRVDQSGTVLDPGGIFIATALGKQHSPSIVFGGTDYFVVWEDGRNPNHVDIYGTRVDRSGVVLDHSGIAIAAVSDDQLSPHVSSNGTNYLVVWQDERNGQHNLDIYGARVSRSGIVLDPFGIAISTAPNNQSSPFVASDGINYLVVWTDNRLGEHEYDIYGTRVDRSGIVLDPEGIPVAAGAGYQRSPSVIFDETDFLVIWEEKGKDFPDYDLYGARISTSGEVIDTYIVCTQLGNQLTPVITPGISDSAFIVYSGWTGEADGKWYNAMRIWGTFSPFVGIEEAPVYQTPYEEMSLQIYPNPFTNLTTISFGKAQGAECIELKIYDATGRIVKDLSCSPPDALSPTHAVWDGSSDAGEKLPSGVYFVSMKTGKAAITRKALLLR